MNTNDELYKVGLALHGPKCPAMPLGLRAGLAAMETLGVQHAPDGQLAALVEIDKNHCSTCFADGVQVATGCTFGKGNIRSLGYGKFGLTLIDNKTGRSVRVVATPEAMRRSQQSEFIEYRKKGVPLIDKVLAEQGGRAVQDRADQASASTANATARVRHNHLRRVRRGDGRTLRARQAW